MLNVTAISSNVFCVGTVVDYAGVFFGVNVICRLARNSLDPVS